MLSEVSLNNLNTLYTISCKMSIGLFKRDLEGIPDFEVVSCGKVLAGFEGEDRFTILIVDDEDTVTLRVYVFV